MLSFVANTSLYLLFLLCIAGLAASAPTTYNLNSPFPYGKLADKILKVNDDVPYMIDDIDDEVRVYPENHFMPFSDLPIPSFEVLPPVVVVPIIDNTKPNIGINLKKKNVVFPFVYRIRSIVKKLMFRKWDTTALVLLRRMRQFNELLRTVSSFFFFFFSFGFSQFFLRFDNSTSIEFTYPHT